MPPHARLFYPAVLLVFLVHCGDGRCNSVEPQATFALKDGWVEFALRKDGRPVANATIQITDEKGVKFGQGETGAEGQTTFPLPRGSSFIVEIKAGERTADPIRLFKCDAGVEPGRVLLSYGLRPCCRSIKSQGVNEKVETRRVPNGEPMPWHWLILVFGASISGVIVVVVWRRYGAAVGSTAREKQWANGARKRKQR